jgi:hypothetical protein
VNERTEKNGKMDDRWRKREKKKNNQYAPQEKGKTEAKGRIELSCKICTLFLEILSPKSERRQCTGLGQNSYF